MPRKNERRRESLDDPSCNTSGLQKGVKELRGLDFVLPNREHGLQNHGQRAAFGGRPDVAERQVDSYMIVEPGVT